MKFASIIAILIWFGFGQHLFAQSESLDPPKASEKAEGWFVVLLKNNPGLGTIVISSFLLPVIILMLTNRQTRKMKEIESNLSLAARRT